MVITEEHLEAARRAMSACYDADEGGLVPRGGTSARLAWEVMGEGWPGAEGLDLDDEDAIAAWLAGKIAAGHVRNELRRIR